MDFEDKILIPTNIKWIKEQTILTLVMLFSTTGLEDNVQGRLEEKILIVIDIDG